MKPTSHPEANGVEVPYERLEPQTLRRLIEEFVSRDGADWGEAHGSLEAKVEQVLQQLRERKVRIVYDPGSQTTNLISCQRE